MFRYLTINQNEDPPEKPEPQGKGPFGHEVYSNIVFNELSYEDQDGNRHELKDPNVEGEGYIRLDLMVSTSRMVKNIVKTEIPGRDGTVKELVNKGDIVVKMRGKILSEKRHFKPKELQEKLRRLRDAPVPVEVASGFLSSEGVETLVIEEASVREQRGAENFYMVEIKGVSETPAEVEVEDLVGQNGQPESLPSF